MKNYISKGICLFIILLTASCAIRDNEFLDAMERIKEIGNDNPEQALLMLDSLKADVQDEGEYVRNKYSLLNIRLNDKADNMPVSDIAIKKLMEYFEAKGTNAEKQEVYYYAGSIYRDLQDTPRALEQFFRSLDYANDHSGDCDPIMLRNTYSNLNYLYYRVQDYKNALKTGIKELESCRQTQTDVIVPFLHVGAAFSALDSIQQAEAALDSAYLYIIRSGEGASHQAQLAFLLYQYSYLENCEKAKECAMLITDDPLMKFDSNSCLSFAWYYESLGRNDSAIVYLKRILEDGTDTSNMYDAAKHLFTIYHDAGNTQIASKYADMYMQLSSSLDFGRRQELAATVNNQYQYHLDQKKEQKLRDEKERYKHVLVYVCMAALLLVCVGYIIYIRRRNRQLQVIADLSTNLRHVSEEGERLRLGIREKEAELARAKEKQERSEEELAAARQAHERLMGELEECNEQIRAGERLLAEKLEQNQAFVRLIHLSELEEKAEEVAESITQSAKSMHRMKASEWKKLYRAVDKMQPTFHESLAREFGRLTEKQMQFCYLMRSGMSKAQVQDITGMSRITIWRWAKRFAPVLAQEGD